METDEHGRGQQEQCSSSYFTRMPKFSATSPFIFLILQVSISLVSQSRLINLES